jgi:hypothetical protein
METAKVTDRVWAATAITLGVWETTALATKRVPTITKTCGLARQRYRRRAELTIIAWLFGLGAHLLRRANVD